MTANKLLCWYLGFGLPGVVEMVHPSWSQERLHANTSGKHAGMSPRQQIKLQTAPNDVWELRELPGRHKSRSGGSEGGASQALQLDLSTITFHGPEPIKRPGID